MNRLQAITEQISQQSSHPVHLWNPDVVGDIDIRIDAQGAWFHEGDPITRDALVCLFASILWFENDQHFLVTPAEKLAVMVEDVPFMIHQAEFVDDVWVVTTNTHEQVVIDAEHSVELRDYQGQWVPYVNVRYDLWARVNRSIYYQWVDEAIARCPEGEPLTLTSRTYAFEVAR